MYHWFDRPPAVNRLMGLIWLTNLLYPEWFDWDLVRETREFYELFYRITLAPGRPKPCWARARGRWPISTVRSGGCARSMKKYAPPGNVLLRRFFSFMEDAPDAL